MGEGRKGLSLKSLFLHYTSHQNLSDKSAFKTRLQLKGAAGIPSQPHSGFQMQLVLYLTDQDAHLYPSLLFRSVSAWDGGDRLAPFVCEARKG